MGIDDVKRVAARPAVQAAGLLVVAFAVYASYASHGDIIPDEAWHLDSCMRVVAGQVPYRDFASIYAPGRFYLFGGVFWLTDGSLLALRLTWALLCAGVVALVFAVGRRMMPRGLALAAALTALVLPGPWHKTLYSLVPLLALYPLARWLETRRRGWLVATGLLGGAGTWFRQDVGLFALATAGSLIVLAAAGRLWPLRGGRRPEAGAAEALYAGLARPDLLRRACGDAAALALPALAVLGAGLLVLVAAGAAGEFLTQAFGQSIAEGAPRGKLVLQALGLRIAGYDPLAGRVVALLCWIPPLLALPVLVGAGRRALAGRVGVADGLLWCVGLCALAVCNQVLRRDVLIRFLQCAPFVILLWFALGAGLLRRAGRGSPAPGRALRQGALLALVLLPPVALAAGVLGSDALRTMPAEYTGTVATRLRPEVPYQVRGRTYFFSPESATCTERLLRFLERRIQPGEPFLVLGRPAGLYYLYGRPSPIRAVRVSDSAVRPLGVERVFREVLDSGLRYVIAEHRFVQGNGRLWLPFLREHGRVAQSDATHAIWEIGS